MVSLTERLKKKAEAELKERMKRTPGAKYQNIGLPLAGYPSLYTEGDFKHLESRVKLLVNTINSVCPWEFKNELFKYIVNNNSKTIRSLLEAKERRDKEQSEKAIKDVSQPVAVQPVAIPVYVSPRRSSSHFVPIADNSVSELDSIYSNTPQS